MTPEAVREGTGRKQAEQIERLGLLWIDVADEKKTA